jgi:hypothetical protein
MSDSETVCFRLFLLDLILFYRGVVESVKHIFGADMYDNGEWTKKSPTAVKQGLMTTRSLHNFKPIVESEVDKVINEWSNMGEVRMRLQSDPDSKSEIFLFLGRNDERSQ